MNKILLIIACCFWLACSKETIEKNGFSYEHFKQNLSADMNYESITDKFGAPLKEIGSGIHIYVYPLKDGTQLWIGYANYIMYAKQVDEDGKVLQVLIE